jgi:hypothetical protein
VTLPLFTVSSSGPLLGRTLVVDKAEMVVGRRPDCDLVLADEFVSRRHAVVRKGPDGVSIEDLGSTGKTFVNGLAIAAKTRLHDGDVVRFGELETVFQAETNDVPAQAKTAMPAPGVAPAGAPPRRSVLVDGLIVCLACGTRNPMGTTFCTNGECGSFLEFTGATPGGGPPVKPPDPDAPTSAGPVDTPRRVERRPAQEEARVGVAIALSAPSLKVDPGGETEVDVTVRNTGTLVDAVTFSVAGAAARWATVEPARLSLMPGAESVTTVKFRPPREPASRAGEAPFEVQARSGDAPAIAASAPGTLTVRSYHEMSVELVPATSRGRRIGAHRLTVRNGGNAPLSVEVTAADPDQLLQLTTSPAHLDIEPGESPASRVQVRARKLHWYGASRTIALKVTARPATGDPVQADAAFAQLPQFPKWFRKALLWPIGMAAVAVVALLAVTKPWQKDPEPVPVANCISPPSDEAGCKQLLLNAGLTVQVRREVSGTAPVNAVLRTEPPAGTPVKAGSSILVTVSDGLKVPNVVGRTEQEARSILTGLGFTVPTPPGMEEGGQRGVVVRTLPAADTVLMAGEAVQIFVATGPTTTVSTTTTSTTTTTTPPTTTSTTRATTTTAAATTTTRPPNQ